MTLKCNTKSKSSKEHCRGRKQLRRGRSCHCIWQPESDPQNTHNGRRELTHKSQPLLPHWGVYMWPHMNTHGHMGIHIHTERKENDHRRSKGRQEQAGASWAYWVQGSEGRVRTRPQTSDSVESANMSSPEVSEVGSCLPAQWGLERRYSKPLARSSPKLSAADWGGGLGRPGFHRGLWREEHWPACCLYSVTSVVSGCHPPEPQCP